MRFQRSLGRLLLFGGLILTGLSLLLIWFGDSALRRAESVDFLSDSGDRLIGTYYLPDDALSKGILILEGFGSDQVTMRNAANEFARMGLHVFTFDFSGHGRSAGALGFDNAANDDLAREVITALDTFKRVSGLMDSGIFLMGHSLGGRVAVQAMILEPRPSAGLILFGPQINLGTNAQSEFFTGTTDADLAWVQKMDVNNPDLPILIISGGLEDILTVPAAQALMEKLTGEKEIVSGVPYRTYLLDSERTWQLIPGVFHNFEVFSGDAFTAAKKWIARISALDLPDIHRSTSTNRRWASWIGCLLGLFSFVLGARAYSRQYPELPSLTGSTINNSRRYLFSRYWLWLPGILMGVLVFAPFSFLPLGFPAFNIYYVVFISGYGAINLLLHIIGKVPGLSGKLAVFHTQSAIDPGRWHLAAILNVGFILLVIGLMSSGWYWTPPQGERLIWMVIFIPLTAMGFVVATIDQKLFASFSRRNRIAVFLAGFVPFVIYALGLAMIRSWSGLISAVLGLVVLLLVSIQGDFTVRLTGNRWVAALLQAFVLYLWIMPQGVLFRF